MKKKVILDTNFLLVPGQFSVDIFSEIDRLMDFPYQLEVLKGTLPELKKINDTGSTKDKMAAKLAVVLIKQKGLKMVANYSTDNVDDSIVRLANKDTYVATQDKELKSRLKKKGVKIITLRQKKYLIIEG